MHPVGITGMLCGFDSMARLALLLHDDAGQCPIFTMLAASLAGHTDPHGISTAGAAGENGTGWAANIGRQVE